MRKKTLSWLLATSLVLTMFVSIPLTTAKAAGTFATGYGWSCVSGLVRVPYAGAFEALPNPTYIPSDLTGADFVGATWYAINQNIGGSTSSTLYTIDKNTGVCTTIGDSFSGLYGFCYDITSGTAYVCSGTGPMTLNTINLANGGITPVGTITSGGMVIAIACDTAGNLYGISLDTDNLISIDKTTGAGTVIGPLGVDINYLQDLAYDRKNGVLYGALCNAAGDSKLYSINTATGAATYIRDLDSELSAFAIPYVPFSGGAGTSGDPYLISNASDLQELAVNVNGGTSYTGEYFKMTADISFGYWQDANSNGIVDADEIYDQASGGTAYTMTSNYTAIGDSTHSFTGTFDGDNHTVSGIYLNESASDYQGLFGQVQSGTVKNVSVEGSYIKGNQRVGGITGFCTLSTIDNCHCNGSVVGLHSVGGIAGRNHTSTIDRCSAFVDISGGGQVVGGITGMNDMGSTIRHCHNAGNVSGGNDSVGGIAGQSDNSSTIEYCYNTGTIVCTGGSSYYVGGIGGYFGSGTTVQYCYNAGSVTGQGHSIGGIGGLGGGTVQYCYNTGNVKGTSSYGGVMGSSAGTVTGCWYDNQMCPVGGINSSDASGQAEGKTTADMTTDTPYTGWESMSPSIWTFTSDLYPRLTGMESTDAAYVSASPVFLTGGDTVSSVTDDFTVSTANSVGWASGNNGVISVSGSAATLEATGSDVTLTATRNDATRTVVIESATAPLSNDAGLTSVLSQNITAGAEAGTAGDPKTAPINVNNAVSTVASTDITAATGATVDFYGTDNTFTTTEPGAVTLTAGGATTVYVKVTAEDGVTESHYAVTISRAAATPGGGGGGGVTAADNNGKNEEVTIDVKSADGSSSVSGTFTETDNGVNIVIDGSDFGTLIGDSQSGVIIDTGNVSVTFDGIAAGYISDYAGSSEISLLIEQVDETSLAALSEEELALIGDRPVYDFMLTADGSILSEFNGGHAFIAIPYVPQSGEDPNAIVVYYIDDSGNLQYVVGAYNAETCMVEFEVTHFSYYAVGYNPVTFADVAGDAWYNDAVTFCAARGITNGIEAGIFAPDDTLTRGQFIVMLMRAYCIELEADLSDNFDDAGDTYYTDYLATAKNLGITNGIGDNLYAPDQEITREQMFTLLYRMLDILCELPGGDTGNTLDNHSDFEDISDYAQAAIEKLVACGVVNGTDGMLDPGGNSTRAQMAQVLYNLLFTQAT